MPATTIDAYLAKCPDEQRAALERLRRRLIRAAAPDAEECISYGIAAFRRGRMLVGFGAAANHCTFHLMSTAAVRAHARDLSRYDTSKGGVRFRPDEPLPAALVRKLVRARLAENDALDRGTKTRRATRRTGEAVVRTKAAATQPRDARTDPAVEALLRDLDHPLKREIVRVREIVVGASPEIREALKWNAPSFRTSDFFATIHLRSRDAVQLVFHRGAKAKDGSTRVDLQDPQGLAKWLATDRCLVTVGAGPAIAKNKAALETIVRAWIRHL